MPDQPHCGTPAEKMCRPGFPQTAQRAGLVVTVPATANTLMDLLLHGVPCPGLAGPWARDQAGKPGAAARRWGRPHAMGMP